MEDIQTDAVADPNGNHRAIIKLSEEDFRRMVVHHFRAGSARMDDMQAQIAAMQTHLQENTDLTRKTSEGTAQLIALFEGTKVTATRFVWCSQRLREFARFIYPFVLLGGAIAAIWHGKWPKLGE